MNPYLPRGASAEGAWSLAVTPERAGWAFCGLRVLELEAGDSCSFASGGDELLVLPLEGGCVVECESRRFRLAGRRGVFTDVSDFAYVPIDAEVRVTSPGGGRFALPSARAANRLDPAYGPVGEIPVELRGAGQCSRQVINVCTPDSFPADKILVVEVLTPEGNWSSYPPHKHDEQRPGEMQLEEIYYFEIGGDGGLGYQRVYSSGPDRQIDVLAEVRSGDVVLVPYGYHGPSMAAPGYDLYYLNVMAGPAPERAWRFCDDPSHAWVRGTWEGQAVDPRLPMTSSGGGT
ncbi:MAG TPA: 5-deoxy-glucuronate isomerase [Actinomycetota bacterium]|nr:5-deoxy-glucuronate isomerase [Actinomycetota bacterium]